MKVNKYNYLGKTNLVFATIADFEPGQTPGVISQQIDGFDCVVGVAKMTLSCPALEEGGVDDKRGVGLEVIIHQGIAGLIGSSESEEILGRETGKDLEENDVALG